MASFMERLEETVNRGVKHINLLFTSLTGKMHSVQIPLTDFESTAKYSVGFDGSSVGIVNMEESYPVLRLDPSTLRIAYWADPPSPSQ